MTVIAVYGTLRRGHSNNGVMGKSKYLGAAYTKEKYELSASGIPFVNPNIKTSHIRVELFEVDDDQLSRVDRLEGYDPNDHEGSWYKRTSVIVTTDKDEKEVKAELYFNTQKGSTVIKSGDFSDYRGRA